MSSDGTTLASAAHSGRVRIWDVLTGVLRQTLDIEASIKREFDLPIGGWGYDGGYDNLAMALSPHGKTLISASVKGVIHLWDTASGTCQQTHECDLGYHPMRIFTPDGNKLVLASDEDEISVRDTATGALHQRIKGRGSPCTALACSPDAGWVVSSDKRGIYVWDTTTGEVDMEMKERDNKGNPTMALAWSRNGKMVAAAHIHCARLWHTAGGEPQSLEITCDTALKTFTFSPDSKILVSTRGTNISLCDAKTGVHLNTFQGHSGVWSITDIAFSPDSKTLVSAYRGTITFWDMASALRDKTFNIFDTEERTGQMLWDTVGVNGMTFSPDGNMIATASGADGARVWDVATGKLMRTFRHPRVRLVCFSPDGDKLVSGSEHDVRLWDVATGILQQEFRHIRAGYVEFSPDGGTLAIGSADAMMEIWDEDADSMIELWDVATGKLLQKLEQGYMGLAAAFSPDGKTLATVTSGGIDGLWDVATGSWLENIPGEQREWFRTVGFRQDGKNPKLASAASPSRWDWRGPDPASTRVSTNTITVGRLSILHNWILKDGKKIFWLPPNYRQEWGRRENFVAYKDGKVALASTTGVIVLCFDLSISI